MDLKRLYRDLPAICLVFGHSAITHENAPKNSSNDDREWSLLNLLIAYLRSASVAEQVPDRLLALLQQWSDDLVIIYDIRSSDTPSLKLTKFAEELLQRIRLLQVGNYTIIPNGLISEKDNGNHEHSCLAVLTSSSVGKLNWTQIDPGSSYHQKLQTSQTVDSDPCLRINNIDMKSFNREWLELLIGLKATHPRGYYKIISLYECLLAQLNGETTFKQLSDNLFITSSYDSPVQIWEVVRETFHYLVKEFYDENAENYYLQHLVAFKQFLLREIVDHYENPANEQIVLMHSLLTEMCSDIAFVSRKNGTKRQKAEAVALVAEVRMMLQHHLDQKYQHVYDHEQIGSISIESLVLDKPILPQYLSNLPRARDNAYIVNDFYFFDKSRAAEKPLDYLNRVLMPFIDKLQYCSDLHDYIGLLKGIEYFFLDYLINAGVLDDIARPFTSNDEEFAGKVQKIGNLYYTVTRKIVHAFPSGLVYEPQYFAKNIIMQFFVYAVIAGLNRRDTKIGSLLRQCNLDTQVTASLSLEKVMPFLVLDDPRFLMACRVLKEFFEKRAGKANLFSYQKFYFHEFQFTITNTADKDDQEVVFAYQLLQQYPDAFYRFQSNFIRQKEEEHNRKWYELAYDTGYLPKLYFHLQTSAFVAKAALTGLYTDTYSQVISPQWFRMTRSDYVYYETYITFDLHPRLPVKKSQENNRLSYLMNIENKDYQKIIFSGEGHLPENTVIAQQYKKPVNLDVMNFLQLGSIQSHALLKIERLYIAIQEGRLDFSNKAHAVLAKQTLFEIGLPGGQSCLERIVVHNPELLYKLGLLLVEKTLAMKLRLMQHPAIADLLEILLKLLAIYPDKYKDILRQGINDIYDMVCSIVSHPDQLRGYDQETTGNILTYLNAYLIMAASAKKYLGEGDTIRILIALISLKKYEVGNIIISNTLKVFLYSIIIDLSDNLKICINQNLKILDQLMQVLKVDWIFGQAWHKKMDSSCGFTCGEYDIYPLLGVVLFKGKSITAVPFDIQNHAIYQSYFANDNFAVMPDACYCQGDKLDCYVSVDRNPKVRLTPMGHDLKIEVLIDDQYHLYLPLDKLLIKGVHPEFLYRDVYSQESYIHYLVNNVILITNKKHEIIYRWDLSNSQISSEKYKANLVPFKHLSSPVVQSIFSRIESPNFIEIYTMSSIVEQVSFPRLQLSFEYDKRGYFSNEISGYKLMQEQKLRILASFKGYLLLINHQKFVPTIKIIIPHYRLLLLNTAEGCSVAFNFDELQSPCYFVYDVDAKLDFVKSSTVHASLYLALLHYMMASLDEDELSGCNGYHLAREYLELAWQAKPYSELELDTLQQFLNFKNIKDFHYNRIALYLKVISLLSHSAQFDFLYPDSQANADKNISALNILRHDDHKERIVKFFATYIRYKSRVLTRLCLTLEEEHDISRYLFQEKHEYESLFRHYIELNIQQGGMVSLPAPSSKNYKEHCRQLFSPDDLVKMEFVDLFNNSMKSFAFSLPPERGVDFFNGIQGVLVDRFRLHNFFELYEIAKSNLSRLTYRYLLHHILLRSQHLNEKLPQTVIQMLGRALLLVAENPERFPVLPTWILKYSHDYDLSISQLKEADFYEELRGPYSWLSDNTENETLWKAVCQYDLDSQKFPDWLPANQDDFVMQYERHIRTGSETKKAQIRMMFIKAVRNYNMRKFFSSVLEICDQLKFSSQLGIKITPVEMYTINLLSSYTPVAEKLEFSGYPNYEGLLSRSLSLEALKKIILTEQTLVDYKPLLLTAKYKAVREKSRVTWFQTHEDLVIESLPVVDLKKFINIQNVPIGSPPFLLQNQLDVENTRYGQHFYKDLKCSWESYCEQSEMSCVWLRPESMKELEQHLLKKMTEHEQLIQAQWWAIEELFRTYSNTEIGHESSLALFAGQAPRYHKGDILRLLLQPDLLVRYHSELVDHQHIVMGLLLSYLTHEITLAKIKRALVLIVQIQQLKDENEVNACLQQLVITLSDSLDKESYQHPTWLLFQFEHDVILRANQRELLLAMSQEPEKVMYQLNMGEGKSTVILPLLCVDLPNQKNILRINVLFSLLTMMESLLRQRLSILLKTRLYMLPFFRETDISTDKLEIISNMLVTCRAQRGILLVTPEHRMCLQLKMREIFLDDESNSEQQRMLREINNVPAIDLLDESDEILRHGTELNFAIGERISFDGYQLRWQIVEFFIKTILLDTSIREIILAGKVGGFTDINEKQFKHGGVPYILLLDENYYNEHIRPLLFKQFIEAYKTSFLNYMLVITDNISDLIPYSLADYILAKLTGNQEQKILTFLEDKASLKMTVLIAKGLLSHGILFYVFNAPYRVKYGLDFVVGKKPVALPFVGKDIPSERSEFSHPDIILGFTFLSYLYEGLNQEQIKAVLIELNMSFSLTVVNQYLQKWFESDRDGIKERFGSFPDKLMHFENLDLNNLNCLEQLHFCLHGNINVILFYVTHCILPSHAQQYRHKISANAHSIVGYHPALGFSGTDDRRVTMPYGVQARSLGLQRATDGKLLAVMTKQTNRLYISVEADSTVELLGQFCRHVHDNPNCHILIDAGALIMGMDNYRVALFLMKELPSKFKGVIYFSDKGNALMVLMRNGISVSLEQCQLEKHNLFAYLDDVHTRGTDLKLPLNCSGILTIGIGMEKDKYTQAAMRLRNLAQQQSLVLWGLSKVTAAIVRDNRLTTTSEIDSLEVLKWVTANTIRHINDDLYFVAIRKVNFCIIRFAEKALADAPVRLEVFIKRCQEEELFALQDFYGFSPQTENLKRVLREFAKKQLEALFAELQLELRSAKVLSHAPYFQQVLTDEQKIELEQQINKVCNETEKYLDVVKFQWALDACEEKEVQVEVVHEQTLTSTVDQVESCEEKEWDFSMILRSDFIARALQGDPIIIPLSHINHYVKSLPELTKINWHPNIYMTINFIQTVKTASDGDFDNYLRLVDMVLVHRAPDGVKCVLLSGYEASRLINNKLYSVHNILVHIKDINGPTQLPLGCQLDGVSQKLLTIVKLFAGECHYENPKEVKRLAKRVGRICSDHFVSDEQGIDLKCSVNIYHILITKGYLTGSGTMTPALLFKLDNGASCGYALSLEESYKPFGEFVFKKLLSLTKKLIIDKYPSILQNQFILWKWIDVRRAKREYPGSELESVLNQEKSIKSVPF